MKRAYDRLSNMEVERDRERERNVKCKGHSSTHGNKEDEDVSNEAWRRVKEQDAAKKVEGAKRKKKEEAERKELEWKMRMDQQRQMRRDEDVR
jgi:hypothetical protein